MMRIKKGDNVVILAGVDRGKTGKVERVFREEGRVLVEGINMKKKHQKPTRSGGAGQIVEIAAPVHISNVALKDPKSGKATRVRIATDKSGKKARVAVKSGDTIA